MEEKNAITDLAVSWVSPGVTSENRRRLTPAVRMHCWWSVAVGFFPFTVEVVHRLDDLRTTDLHYSHNVMPNRECDERRRFSAYRAYDKQFHVCI